MPRRRIAAICSFYILLQPSEGYCIHFLCYQDETFGNISCHVGTMRWFSKLRFAEEPALYMYALLRVQLVVRYFRIIDILRLLVHNHLPCALITVNNSSVFYLKVRSSVQAYSLGRQVRITLVAYIPYGKHERSPVRCYSTVRPFFEVQTSSVAARFLL